MGAAKALSKQKPGGLARFPKRRADGCGYIPARRTKRVALLNRHGDAIGIPIRASIYRRWNSRKLLKNNALRLSVFVDWLAQ
jgi:hypothetical protein